MQERFHTGMPFLFLAGRIIASVCPRSQPGGTGSAGGLLRARTRTSHSSSRTKLDCAMNLDEFSAPTGKLDTCSEQGLPGAGRQEAITPARIGQTRIGQTIGKPTASGFRRWGPGHLCIAVPGANPARRFHAAFATGNRLLLLILCFGVRDYAAGRCALIFATCIRS